MPIITHTHDFSPIFLPWHFLDQHTTPSRGHAGYPVLVSYWFAQLCESQWYWRFIPSSTSLLFSYIIQNVGKPIALFATCFHAGLLLAYSSTLKMEVTCSSETLVDFQQTTWCYIPKCLDYLQDKWQRGIMKHKLDNQSSCSKLWGVASIVYKIVIESLVMNVDVSKMQVRGDIFFLALLWTLFCAIKLVFAVVGQFYIKPNYMSII
jgi:hypothetical protein